MLVARTRLTFGYTIPSEIHDPQFKNSGLENMDDYCLTELKVNPKQSWPWSTKAELGTH